MELGLKRKKVLEITALTKHQLYYQSRGKVGKHATEQTLWLDRQTGELLYRPDEEVVIEIIEILSNAFLPNWYRSVCFTLQVHGWYINHKKVYRLERENGLLSKARKKTGRSFVKYRRVAPLGPLRVLEMDIKYVWVGGANKYVYVLTIIDTFTRYVLGWQVGYQMRQEQVKSLWDEVIVNHLQAHDMLNKGVEIEVRNDNGKQFSSQMIQTYFNDNYLEQVFTHPYTPQENGHIESFHSILSKAVKNKYFHDIQGVEKHLKMFYKTYNNERQHGAIAMLSPSMFWALWEDEQIERIALEKRKVRFRLRITYQEVLSWPKIARYTIG